MNNIAIISLFVFLSVISITVFIEYRLVPFLTKRATQPIYTDGPSWHMSKSGTPTMGGIAFLVAISLVLGVASVLLFVKQDLTFGISMILTLFFSIGNALIGILDDLTKLKRKENAGLSPMQKLLLQLLLSIIFLMARKFFFDDPESIAFSFGDLDLGLIYYPFAIILLLGIVNCANLTDGIDGLAASTSSAIGLVYLLIGLITKKVELSICSAALIGGSLGFLGFNRHPAKIFMGDTGSLFLGALAAGLAFSSGNPSTIILTGGVYVIEGISVILQVLYFKLTKKRLFKMAPLHHHLEKSGLGENKICVCAVLLTLILSALSILIFGV